MKTREAGWIWTPWYLSSLNYTNSDYAAQGDFGGDSKSLMDFRHTTFAESTSLYLTLNLTGQSLTRFQVSVPTRISVVGAAGLEPATTG